MTSFKPIELSPTVRLLAAALALATTAIVGGVLLGAWSSRADPTWLRATPEVLAEVAACDELRDRAVRDGCKRSVVAARTVPQSVPVAAGGQATDAER